MSKLTKSSLAAGLALLIVFFFTSCAEDEQPALRIPPGNSLYVASAIIAPPAKTETEVNTRVAGDDVPVTVTAGSLGIFRSKGTGYTGSLNNLQYTYMGADNGWQPATAADTLFLNGDDAEVCAYYPHNADAAYQDATALPLYSGKYTGTSALHDPNDLCYAIYRTVNAARRATTFEMKHALSLLEFRISKEAGYVGDCRITSIGVMNPDLLTESSIDITTGTYGTTPTKGTITYNPGADADGILIESTAVTTGALLVPFTPSAEGLTIAFAVNGTPVEANIPTTDIAQLEAGHRYSVKVTMKAGSMEVTGVDMMPWDEVGVGGDDYTWYPVEEEKVIDIGLDFVFAPGNLVAEGSKGNITGYHFAAEQGYYTGTEGGGKKEDGTSGNDYFFWNQLDPCDIDASYNNPARVWNYTLDPCRQIKGGMWYTPTSGQLQKLVDMCNNNQSVWSTYTMQDVPPISGLYFGTSSESTAQADQNKYLFLPASGFAMNGLDYYEPSRTCFAWSSTPSTKANNAMAFVYFHGSGGASIDYLPVDQSATPVRCVKDKPIPNPAHAIRIPGLNFYVADGNVRAISNGAAGYTYQFADEQGYYSGVNNAAYNPAGGDYFCWNTLDPAATASTNTSTVWNDADDVCRKIGDGKWYTPTLAQLLAFVDAAYVWDNKAYTMKDNTSKAGMYCGISDISTAKANQGEYVFLPAAGFRQYGIGTIIIEGSYGYYWSSTPLAGNTASSYNFNFSGSSVNGPNTISRNHGSSVRCVRDK